MANGFNLVGYINIITIKDKTPYDICIYDYDMCGIHAHTVTQSL